MKTAYGRLQLNQEVSTNKLNGAEFILEKLFSYFKYFPTFYGTGSFSFQQPAIGLLGLLKSSVSTRC
jgi:hypothetical protein